MTFEDIEKVPAELKGSRTMLSWWKLVEVWHMEQANGMISCGAEIVGLQLTPLAQVLHTVFNV